jgi:hypothetical protein
MIRQVEGERNMEMQNQSGRNASCGGLCGMRDAQNGPHHVTQIEIESLVGPPVAFTQQLEHLKIDLLSKVNEH